MRTFEPQKLMRLSGRVAVMGLLFFSAMGSVFANDELSKGLPPEVKVGDQWKLVQKDARTGIVELEVTRTVSAVTAEKVEGTENDKSFAMTHGGVVIDSSTLSFSGDLKTLDYPLQVGKKWEYKQKVRNHQRNMDIRRQASAHVEAVEKIKVPAGEFEAFRVQTDGYWNNETTGRSGSFKMTSWYSPAAKHVVKFIYNDGFTNSVTELVEMKLN